MRSKASLLAVGVCSVLGGCLGVIGDFSVGDGTGPTNDGSVEAGSFTVTPAVPSVAILRRLSFTASVPVTWSIEEPTGGTIDATGAYLAPAQPGIYHLVAARQDKPTDTQRFELKVVDLDLVKIAGGGAAGRGSLDGLATEARFGRQSAIDIDPSTSAIYIADTENHTIRALVNVNGQLTVTTAAGLGGAQGTNNAAGSLARFNRPVAVAAYRDTVYISEANRYCVRALDVKSGNVTTYAGTCGTTGSAEGSKEKALFGDISHLALFPSGWGATAGVTPKMLLACEHGASERIRAIDLATGQTSTFYNGGGSCAAGAIGSNTVAGVSKWDQFLFSNNGSIVLEQHAALGAVTGYSMPFAQGTGFAAFTNGPTSGSTGHFAYVSGEAAIYQIDFSDTKNNKILAGLIAEPRVADGPIAQTRFARIRGMTSNPTLASLYVSDSGSNTIRKIDGLDKPGTATSSTIAGRFSPRLRQDGTGDAALFCAPTSISISGSAAYVTDANDDDVGDCNVIRKVDLATGVVTTFSGKRSTKATQVRKDGAAVDAGYIAPFDTAATADALYLVEIESNAVRKVSLANGAVELFAGDFATPGNLEGLGAQARFNQPAGVATDGAGKLFVTDNGNSSIRAIDLATKAVTTLAGSVKGTLDGIGKAAQFVSPVGLAYDGAGHLFVADSDDGTIRQIDVATAAVSTLIGVHGQKALVDGDKATARLQNPLRVTYDGAGGLLVAEGGFGDSEAGGLVRRVDIAKQTISTFVGKTSERGFRGGIRPTARVNGIVGMTFDPTSGDTFFTDYVDAVVGRFKPSAL